MMKGKVIVVCGIVALLGIISAAAGFAAEATKVKVSEVRIEQFSCVYPSSPALGLGILAGIFAIITRIALFMLVGCCSCCRPHGTTINPLSNIFNILSWIASVIAVILLFAGAALNNREGGEIDSYGYIRCYVVRPGILATGAMLSLLSTIFGIVAYLSIKQSALLPELRLPDASNEDIEKNVPVNPQQ